MTRRGFTLIETVIALSISAIILAAIFTALSGVWVLAKHSSDELQGALHARSVRERLYYSLERDGERNYGLISATNILVCVSGAPNELVAQFPNEVNCSVMLGAGPFGLVAGSVRSSDKALQSVYIAARPSAKATYYDRIVVPVFGRHPEAREGGTGASEVLNCFHNKD